MNPQGYWCFCRTEGDSQALLMDTEVVLYNCFAIFNIADAKNP